MRSPMMIARLIPKQSNSIDITTITISRTTLPSNVEYGIYIWGCDRTSSVGCVSMNKLAKKGSAAGTRGGGERDTERRDNQGAINQAPPLLLTGASDDTRAADR